MLIPPHMNLLAQSGILDRWGITQTAAQTPITAWIAALASFGIGVVVAKVVQGTLRSFARRWAERGVARRAAFFRSLASPLALLCLNVSLTVAFGSVSLADAIRPAVHKSIAFLYIFSLAWFLFNIVDVLRVILLDLTSKTESTLDDQLVPVACKGIRVVIILVFFLFIAENVFGADITTWLAGLGIAGLAISLAAQDSIKNIFGSLTVFVDRPFQLKDTITIADQTGIVEEIGFRSTKIRTFDGFVVTIPNSRVADGAIQNLSHRPTIRRVVNLSLVATQGTAKLEKARDIVRGHLASDAFSTKLDLANPPRVFLGELNSDAAVLQVIYWYTPPSDWWGYVAHAEALNLAILKSFEENSIELASPLRRLVVDRGPEAQHP